MGKRIPYLALACLLAFSFCIIVPGDVSAAVNEDPEPEPEPVEVKGLSGTIFDIQTDKNVPIPDVNVIVWDSNVQRINSTYTDEKGEFTIDYNSNVAYISFTLEGFTVRGWSSVLEPYGETDYFIINLPENPTVDDKGVFNMNDSGGYTALLFRTTASVFGNVYTVIDGSERPVEGAEVILTTTKETLRTTTDSDGSFTIVTSSGVTYNVSVVADGFLDWTIIIEPSEDPLNIKLIQRSHDVFLGMDMAHTIALIGIVLVILIALATIYLGRKPETMDGVYVVNDIKPREILDADEDSKSDE